MQHTHTHILMHMQHTHTHTHTHNMNVPTHTNIHTPQLIYMLTKAPSSNRQPNIAMASVKSTVEVQTVHDNQLQVVQPGGREGGWLLTVSGEQEDMSLVQRDSPGMFPPLYSMWSATKEVFRVWTMLPPPWSLHVRYLNKCTVIQINKLDTCPHY